MNDTVTQDTIQQAIRFRSVLRLNYWPGERFIEPHCMGRSRNGDLLLRGYQVAGASASGEHENWKLFRIERISEVDKTDQTFQGPRPKYNPDDSVMKGGIIERLEMTSFVEGVR